MLLFTLDLYSSSLNIVSLRTMNLLYLAMLRPTYLFIYQQWYKSQLLPAFVNHKLSSHIVAHRKCEYLTTPTYT